MDVRNALCRRLTVRLDDVETLRIDGLNDHAGHAGDQKPKMLRLIF